MGGGKGLDRIVSRDGRLVCQSGGRESRSGQQALTRTSKGLREALDNAWLGMTSTPGHVNKKMRPRIISIAKHAKNKNANKNRRKVPFHRTSISPQTAEKN